MLIWVVWLLARNKLQHKQKVQDTVLNADDVCLLLLLVVVVVAAG